MDGLNSGKAGRPRLPTAMKALKGTLRKHRESPDEPVGEYAPIHRAPRGLRPVERRLWQELSAAVNELGATQRSDRPAFARMVMLGAKALDLWANPDSLSQAVQVEKLFDGFMVQFGLCPAARARIKSLRKPAQVEDPMAEFVQ